MALQNDIKISFPMDMQSTTLAMNVVSLPGGAARSQFDQGGETQITKKEIKKRSTMQH